MILNVSNIKIQRPEPYDSARRFERVQGQVLNFANNRGQTTVLARRDL